MNLITKKHKAKHTMKTYNKSRKLSTQTSFLITLTIALITSISAGLFLQKTYKELTLNFQTLMYQESNMTISSISDDISTIDSIYRLLVSNNTIYGIHFYGTIQLFPGRKTNVLCPYAE